jgi:polygalacturonase
MDKSNRKAIGNLSRIFYGIIFLSVLLIFSSASSQPKLSAPALAGDSSMATTAQAQKKLSEESELPLEERIRRTPAGGVIEPIHAPFSMPQLKRPVFPGRTFSIADYGAKSGGKTKNTKAFAKAIKACNKAGGGKVFVPAGKWLTGPIHLKSNVHLYLSEGSEIFFSDRFEDYLPVVFTRWEGVECYNYSPFIYAKDCENIAITGPGVLNGNGKRWWTTFPKHAHDSGTGQRLLKAEAEGTPVKERVFGTVADGLRPAFIQPVHCRNVWLEGFELKNGAFWSVQMIYCENAIVRKLTLRTQGYPNGDGVNADSSHNVLIEYCHFETEDDAVAIKSGKNEDGRRVGKPSENIVVRHCYSKGPCWGSISIGSEMSGGVRNVYVKDVEFEGTLLGFYIKTKPGRGGVVENVWIEDVVARNLRHPVFFLDTAYGADTFTPSVLAMPRLRNIFARNIRSTHPAVSNRRPIEINGLDEVPVRNVRLEDFTCQSKFGPTINLARQIQLDNVHVTVQEGPAFTMKNCQDVTLSNSAADKPCKVFLRVEGENSGNIHLENNDLRNADKAVQLGEEVPPAAVKKKP